MPSQVLFHSATFGVQIPSTQTNWLTETSLTIKKSRTKTILEKILPMMMALLTNSKSAHMPSNSGSNKELRDTRALLKMLRKKTIMKKTKQTKKALFNS
jgi:hypothetical protein